VSRRGQRSTWMRKAVSAVSAYAFVLQIILGSIVATQMVAATPADAFAFCAGDSHDVGDPAGKPATRLAHSACMVCAFATFAPPIPETATVALGIAPAVFFRHDAPNSGRHPGRHEPRSSQGPPQTA
jgi:hypothetical protein